MSPFDGAEEQDPDQLTPVDPAEDLEEEVVVVEVRKGGSGRGTIGGRRGRGGGRGRGRGSSLPPDTEESEEEAA